MNLTNIIVGFIVVILGVLAGWYFLGGKPQAPAQDASSTQTPSVAVSPTTAATSASELYKYTEENGIGSPTTGASEEKGGVVEPSSNTQTSSVSLSEAGFTPVSLTVKVGTIVSFVNNSSTGMWVASAVHPTHQLLPGFDQLKTVGRGGTYSYTFAKVGTWKYHNHVDASVTGSVVVTE